MNKETSGVFKEMNSFSYARDGLAVLVITIGKEGWIGGGEKKLMAVSCWLLALGR